MADVNVNIRGRDEGFGDALDSLRKKAQDLGRDVEELNRLSEKTPTQQKLAIDREGQSLLKTQQERIREEHSQLRQSNIQDYRDTERDFKAGRIGQDEFSEATRRFKEAQQESLSTEEQELNQVQKEMTLQLRLIHREMMDQRKVQREKAQRDRSEFKDGASGGVMGSLAAENAELKKQKLQAKSADEVAELEQRIQSNKQRMREMEGKKEDEKIVRFDAQDATSLAQAMASANLAAAGTQTLKGGGQILGMSKAGATAAGIFAAAYGLLSQSSQMYEAGAGLGALRGRGYGSADSMRLAMGESTEGFGGIGAEYGLTPVQVMEMAEGKARRSGIVGTDITRRSMDDLMIQRAFGADVSGFDEFERFTTTQDESAQISLDILNVLNNIHQSSLKEGDLVTFGEKISTMQTLMSIQRSKRDLVDTDDSLRLLAAFEAIGLSNKGEKASDFMQQTIGGLGEGGSDNLMLLKYEAAKQAHPELAHDPAALRRFIRFNPDDPEYMNQFFHMSGRMTGDNQMAQDDLLYSMFNPQSEEDMRIYERAMQSGDFSAIMTGQRSLKGQRGGSMTMETAYDEASAMVGGLDTIVAGFKEVIGDAAGSLENWLRGVSGGGQTIDVTIAKSKLGSMPVGSATKGTRPKTGGK